jgi:tetratricopeptide (TPR) repeat protein
MGNEISQEATTADPRSLLVRARDHFRAGRISAAEEVCAEIAGTWPSAPVWRHELGLLYAQSGRMEQAVEQIGAAQRLAPDEPLYLVDLGRVYQAIGRLDDAGDAYRRALELRPAFADAYFHLGNLNRLQRKPHEAVASYRRALAADPAAHHVQINLGVALQEVNEFDEAVAVLKQATALDPQSFASQYNLALVLAAQRHVDEAILAYQKAIALNPRAAPAHINLGVVLVGQGRLDEAIECFRRGVTLAPNFAQAYISLGAALFKKGQIKEARDAIHAALKLDPTNALAYVTLGDTVQSAGDLPGSLESYRRALKLDPQLSTAKAQLSIALCLAGKWDEARSFLDYPALLKTRRLEKVDGWASVDAFNADLARYVYAHPTLLRDPPGRATQHGSQTMEFLNSADAPSAALQRFIEESVNSYLASAPAGRESTFTGPPGAWRLHGWAVVLRSSGYQTPHFHPTAVVSGVYYVKIPEAVKAGRAGAARVIKFGPPRDPRPGAHAIDTPLTATIKPEEGLIVLFPSYFWHYTIPFESGEDRISVAFDVMDA